MTIPYDKLANFAGATVRCPRCKAPAGARCVTKEGAVLVGSAIGKEAVHEKRVRAYLAYRRGR